MKSKVGLTFALSIALVCIALVAYSGVGFAKFTQHSFTLTVTGGSLSPKLTVALTLTGTTFGDDRKVFVFFVDGGTLTVQNYGTFTIPTGSGIVVLSKHFIDFEIKVTPKYGGHLVNWHLFGFTGDLVSNSFNLILFEDKVVVPTSGNPVLYGLSLVGTLTLS